MNKIQTSLLGITLIVLSACGMSDTDKEEIAIITCNVISESRNMDAAMRIKELNAAREKIGEERFLQTDAVIKESMEYSLCKDLVLNDSYDEKLDNLKTIERIANSKTRIEKKFYPSGNLKMVIPYQSKSDGGRMHGLLEGFYETGELLWRKNYINGKQQGLGYTYHKNGEIKYKTEYKDDEADGWSEEFNDNGELINTECWKNGSSFRLTGDTSYCRNR